MLRSLLTTVLILVSVVGTGSPFLPQTSNDLARPLSLSQVWTLDATYTDRQHGVTFRYPATWESTTQFAYHPPALTISDSKPIAGFGYSEGGFPRGRAIGPYTRTNLEGVGIVYSAVPVRSAAKCESKAASLSDSPKHSQAVFGERSFSVYKTGDGGMSQYIEGNLYAIYLGRICYLFETDVATASPAALDDIPALTTAQYRDIDKHLLEIMKSVRVSPTTHIP